MSRKILVCSQVFTFTLLSLLCGCKSNSTESVMAKEPEKKARQDSVAPEEPEVTENRQIFSMENVPANFVEISVDTLGIILDLRYATENNFTKKQIYDCPRCFFRKEVAEKIVAVHQDLRERYGFGIKLFDCYRPSAYQKRLWEIVPDPDYVTPPVKGSVHSRGMAVDLTIVDKKGKELDMGTAFDFFGKEAHTDYYELPDNVLKNRQLLKKIMEIHGFRGIRTEWWHYSYRNLKGKINHWVWTCE